MLSAIPFILIITITVACANEGPLVEISNGLLRGTHRTSYNGRTFSSFEGIPYARPPVGELRFEAPKEPYDWTGTWIANTTHTCLQWLSMPGMDSMVAGDEDCLYLNVYVPREKPTSSDNLNVIIHFHGGAFMIGSGHHYASPNYLMDEDVIFVTMNYRVGPFGFLSTEDEVVSGNSGMKDQVLFLKWIQKNIKQFGGNPNSVTLTGTSAGGASVHLHYFSSLSKGLFHRGLSDSGTALNPWTIQEAALEKAKQLATFVGCPTATSRELVDCLKTRSGNKIVDAIKNFYAFPGAPLAPFAPTIETTDDEAFLTQQPYTMLINNDLIDVPWVASMAEYEGNMFAMLVSEKLSDYHKNFEKIAPHLLEYNYTIDETEKKIATNKILEHYFQSEINLENYGKLVADRLFLAGADISVKLQAKANKSPVFFYIFGYKGKHSILGAFLKDGLATEGAGHGESALYYLITPMHQGKLTEQDEKMKDIFLTWLISYANNQEPRLPEIKWEQVTGSEELEHLFIRSPNDIKMKTIKDLGSNSFWNELPLKENQNLINKKMPDKIEL